MILFVITGMLLLFVCIAAIVFKISENKERKIIEQHFMQTTHYLRQLSEHASRKR